MTPQEIRSGEAAIFAILERDKAHAGRLYKDGVPSPEIFVNEPVRVLFVFREPSMGNIPFAVDMRDEVRDEHFQPLIDGARQERRTTCWWNAKAGMFAHAVAAALDNAPPSASYRQFARAMANREWLHPLVNRFAYVQIKKVGGGGSVVPSRIVHHAHQYREVLRRQVQLYKPHLILGCGVGSSSPAKLMAELLDAAAQPDLRKTGASWWRCEPEWKGAAIVQLWHPARRSGHADLYLDVFKSVAEVTRAHRILAPRH